MYAHEDNPRPGQFFDNLRLVADACRRTGRRMWTILQCGTICDLPADITENNCHIMRIAIDPELQNRGLASALLKQMISHCTETGITNYSVNTNKNDLPAVAFYDSLNLKKTGDVFPVFYKYI